MLFCTVYRHYMHLCEASIRAYLFFSKLGCYDMLLSYDKFFCVGSLFGVLHIKKRDGQTKTIFPVDTENYSYTVTEEY